MRHFISFQKRKSIYVGTGGSKVIAENVKLVHQLNHELMKYGFILSKPLFNALTKQSKNTIAHIYNDVSKGIKEIVGGDGYSPTYVNFPDSVLNITYEEFFINAILYYWSGGEWRSEDSKLAENKALFGTTDLKDLKTVKLDTEKDFNAIFTNILYSKSSMSAFDKKVVDWFISQGTEFDFGKITFNETKAYVGMKMFATKGQPIRIKDATTLLRTWAAFSGQDEGLKGPITFVAPDADLRKRLLKAIDGCYNLEEAFKMNRTKWLRALFFLHPMTESNAKRYPNVAKYANLLRNEPKKLKTFAARVEAGIQAKDEKVTFELLMKRPGVFTRMLDQLYRTFGMVTIQKWLQTNPLKGQLLTAYNHFSGRDETSSRSAVLASAGQSEVVNYKELKPLKTSEVDQILGMIMNAFKALYRDHETKIWIDRSLYFRPLTTNNRASSLSLSSKSLGTAEKLGNDVQCVRTYVHWHGRSDIDLSGWAIEGDKAVKIGWDGMHKYDDAIVYSGDNTGHNNKNAEYLDVYPSRLPKTVETVILDARIYRGPVNYAGYVGKARAGYMSFTKDEQVRNTGTNWLPDTLGHSIVLENQAKSAYLLAYHVPTNSIIYLDVAKGTGRIARESEALEINAFLQKFIPYSDTEISWKKLYQGHLLELTAGKLVDNPRDADKVFGENTSSDEVETYL